MANTTLTHKVIAQRAAMLLEARIPFCMNANRGRESEFRKIGGYKTGDFVDIGVHSTGPVFTTDVYADGGAAPDNTEQSVRLQLNIPRHVTLRFTAKEQALDVTEYEERFLAPKMKQLSAAVENEMMKQAVLATPTVVGTAGTIPASLKTYGQARAKLNNFLTASPDRCVICSSEQNTELSDALRLHFHPDREIRNTFLEGKFGHATEADWYESDMCPTVTNGTQTAAALTVNGASQTGTAINVNCTSGATLKKGQVVTLPGCFAVHPYTGEAYTYLRQWSIAADVTFAGITGTITLTEAVTPGTINKNCSASPTTGQALTIHGAASAAVRYNLMFSKEAFTIAFAPKAGVAGSKSYTAQMPSGISVRVMTFGDGKNDLEDTRIDVLAGFAAVRPSHACRISE